MTIKAIETRYAGCRFRSRIEARWAIVFDECGIKWEYEPEGFELLSGRYLPDFYIPEFEAWFEIKGGKPTTKEIDLARDLADASGQLVVIFSGTPEIRAEQATFFRPNKPRVAGCYLAAKGDALTKPLSCRRKTIWLDPSRRLDDRAAIPAKVLEQAITKARSARFEHGEKP